MYVKAFTKQTENPQMDGNDVLKYVEPIYHFCLRRIANRVEAEDLASEIILHILDGVNHFQITFFEAWVWRIAHNRYARYSRFKRKSKITLPIKIWMNLRMIIV